MTVICYVEACVRPVNPRDGRARGSKGLCNPHYQKLRLYGDPLQGMSLTDSVETRFWARVDKSPHPEGCWFWTGRKTDQGYGDFWVSAGSDHNRAHRMAYEYLVGPIPEGLSIDHTCHNDKGCNLNTECPHRACVNPDHLEPVTHEVNTLRGESFMAHNARKTHCPQGHEYSEDNTYTHKGKTRSCKECHRINVRLAHREAAGITGVGVHERYKKTHCKHGHEFTEENTSHYTSPAGVSTRQCLACRKIKNDAKPRKGPGVPRKSITHCRNGHEYTEDNTYVAAKTGRRSCKTCRKVASDASNKKRSLARDAR